MSGSKRLDAVERFRKLAIKRGLTPGALLDASPADFDLLLLAVRRELAHARNYSEPEVNDVLKGWLHTAGVMLAVDHVEWRRWLVDFGILARDAYGRAYTLAAVPTRLQAIHADVAAVDFRRESADANAEEARRREARKAAWQQSQAASG